MVFVRLKFKKFIDLTNSMNFTFPWTLLAFESTFENWQVYMIVNGPWLELHAISWMGVQPKTFHD